MVHEQLVRFGPRQHSVSRLGIRLCVLTPDEILV
jgi:hypothetical protein